MLNRPVSLPPQAFYGTSTAPQGQGQYNSPTSHNRSATQHSSAIGNTSGHNRSYSVVPSHPSPSRASTRPPLGPPMAQSFSAGQLVAHLSLYTNDKCAVSLCNMLEELSLPANVCYQPPIRPLSSFQPKSFTKGRLLTMIGKVRSLPIPSSLPINSYHLSLKVLLLLLSYHCHALVIATMLDCLSLLAPHSRYWKKHSGGTVMDRLNSYIASSIPLVQSLVMSDHRGLRIHPITPNEKLAKLLRLRRTWLTRIGKCCYRHSVVHLFVSKPVTKELLIEYERLCLSYQLYCHRIINGNTPTNGDIESNNSNGVNGSSSDALLSLLSSTLDGIDEFKEWFHTQYQPLRQPSHLARYWLSYTSAGLVTALSVRHAYLNRELLVKYIETSIDSFAVFVDEHVTEPLKNIYDSVFSTLTNRSLLYEAHQNLQQSQQTLKMMLRDFAGKTGSVTVNSQPDMSVVMDHYSMEINHPFKSLVFGDLLQAFLIQVQQLKVQGEAAMVTLDQLLSANQINFNILATIPAVLLAASVIMGIQRTVWRIVNSGKDRQTILASVKKRLSKIESICILALYHRTDADTGTNSNTSNDNELYDRARLIEEDRERLELGENPSLTVQQAKLLNSHRHADNDSDDDWSDDDIDIVHESHSPDSDSDSFGAVSDRWSRLLQQKYLSDLSYGHTLLCLHSMPNLTGALPSHDYNAWLRDVSLLSDCSVTPWQKILTLQKMGRTQPLLQHH